MSTTRMHQARVGSLARLGALALCLGIGAHVQAATITVASGADAGGTCPGASCTLRAAIAAASPGDTINFSVATVTLTSAELLVDKNLRIVGGSGVTVTRQAGSPDFRIFQVAAGAEVEFSNLTISNGASSSGAGIRNNGTLLVTDSAIRNNQCIGSGSGFGCGIYNGSSGVLTLGGTNVHANSTAAAGVNRGGGIYNDDGQLALASSAVYENTLATGTLNFGAGIATDTTGLVEMFESRVADNQCGGTQAVGGGIYNRSTMIIRRSTVSGNTAQSTRGNVGGGIFNETGAWLTIDNSTLSGNTTVRVPGFQNGGAGLYNLESARAVLIASTISANDAANAGTRAGGAHSEGLLIVSNSLIDGNSSGIGAADISANLISAGHNLLGNNTGVTISGISTGNQFNLPELVSPLGAWGGPQSTHALLPGSPAINAGATPSEIQQLTVSGTAGSFTLTFNGQTTAPLPFDASPAAVQAALEGLSSIGSGNVVVVSGESYVVMFTGARAGTNLADITSAGEGGASVTQRTLWNGGALVIDQRSTNRPQQGTPDIGAFESRGFTLAITGGNNQITNVNDPFPTPLSLSVTSTGGEPVNDGRVSFTPPASGASASVSPNPVTISGGAATPGSVTANGTVGGPYLLATTARGANTVNFSLSNRALPVLSISDATITEGNTGTQTLTFTVTRTGVTGSAAGFSFATANNTATAVSDYLTASGTGSIPAGGATGTAQVSVTINGDTVFENDESFFVNLGAPTNATIGDGQGIGTITNDDQQTTTTTVTTTPAPSIAGQPYTVNVSVTGTLLSPTGSVTVSDGNSNCGPVALVAGAAPLSTASCALTGSSAGTRTVTATYTPANATNLGSSGSTSHTVNLIATSLSVSGPSRVQVGAVASYFANLTVNPSGLPAPTGTLTLTAGSSTCTATLPNTGCNLLFNTPGPVTVTASYSGDSAHAAATSSGAGNRGVVVFALADVSVSKSNGQSTYLPGDLLVYTVIVGNAGPNSAHALRIRDVPPAGLGNISWSCVAAGGAGCPVPNGTGLMDLNITQLPVNGTLTFTYSGNVVGSPAQISNTAELILPADTSLEDSNPANNSATDTDQLETLFRDGFEAPQVTAGMGVQSLPLTQLAHTVDDEARVALSLSDIHGEALRVYARLHGPDLQFALAQRDARGLLQLGPWQTWQGETEVHWTALPLDSGWVLESGQLR